MGHDLEWAFDTLADIFPHCIAEALQTVHYMLKRLVIMSFVVGWTYCVAHTLFALAHAIGGAK